MESAGTSAPLSQASLPGPWPDAEVDAVSPRPLVDLLGDGLLLVGATSAGVYRIDRGSQGLVLVASAGPQRGLHPTWFPSGVGLIGLAEESGAVVRCDDADVDP